jgi:hypothetical protein
VVDGETGIILPPGDARALADAILRLLHDPVEAGRLGRNARRRYEAGYTPDVMARRIEAVFEEVYAVMARRIEAVFEEVYAYAPSPTKRIEISQPSSMHRIRRAVS